MLNGPLPSYFPASLPFLETLELGSMNVTGGLDLLGNLTLLSRWACSCLQQRIPSAVVEVVYVLLFQPRFDWKRPGGAARRAVLPG